MSFGSWQSTERQGSGLWRSLTDGDFEEEDVWDVLKGRNDSISRFSKSIDSSVSVPKHILSSARMIPKPNINTSSNSSNSTSATNSHQTLESKPVQQQSAPLTIPNWPKNYHKKSTKSDSGDADDDDDDYEDFDDGGGGDDDDDDCDDYVGEEIDKMPPHELIAKRLARTHISSFSVLEGIGRKLKGRDLSEVRNAILTKTGFLESL